MFGSKKNKEYDVRLTEKQVKELTKTMSRGERKEFEGYYEGPNEPIRAVDSGYKWYRYKFAVTIPALAAIIYRVDYLPEEAREQPVTLEQLSLDMAVMNK